MHTARPSRRIAGAALAAAMLLSACMDGSAPEVEDSISAPATDEDAEPTTAPSPSEEPSTSPSPEAAPEPSPEPEELEPCPAGQFRIGQSECITPDEDQEQSPPPPPAPSPSPTATQTADPDPEPEPEPEPEPVCDRAPQTITVRAFNISWEGGNRSGLCTGDKVTFVNDDSSVFHNGTADDGSFATGNIDPGASATVTITTAGTITYKCTIHPSSMKGTFVVDG